MRTPILSSDVAIPHFKLIMTLLPIPAFRANINDTANTNNTSSFIEHHP